MKNAWALGLLLCTLSWHTCVCQKPLKMNAETRALAREVEAMDYPTLIYADGLPNAADQIELLRAIVQSSDATPRARFLAAELLRKSKQLDLSQVNSDALAEAYCQALLTCTSEGGFSLGLAGNAWGFLWYNDDPGLGQVLLDIGRSSVPALQRLASRNEVVAYEGSEEATLGSMLSPRAKDFAAYYLHRITGIATRRVTLGDHDFAARDAAILQLLSSLPK